MQNTCKDRTAEFKSFAEFLLKSQKIRPVEKKQTRADIVKNTISVNKRASEIGRRTSTAAIKLKELTELAKSRSPFGDPTEKIERLTETITQDINAIKFDIEDLERFVASNGGNKQSSDHSVTVIHALNTSLLHTTKELNDALQIRTQNMKTQQERRDRVLGSRRLGPAPTHRPNFDFLDDDVEHNGSDDVIIPLMQTEDNLILQRSNAVRDIESHITEIQSIFKKLSALVALQTEQLQRIEDNVDTTIIHADSALAELLKYLKGMSSDRWLLIKAFVMIAFFLFLWFMFFA